MSEFTPALWTVQLAFDMMAAVFIAKWFLTQRDQAINPPEQKIEALIQVIQQRAGEWEKAAQQNKTRAEQQLRALARICEQANQTLSRAKLHNGSLVPSEEENELRAFSAPTDEEKIPSLEQIQKTRKRIKNEMALSLKALLSEQLN